MYSVTMHGCGISKQAPIKVTRRLCLRWRKDSTSFAKSCITTSSLMVLSQKSCLIATSSSLKRPRHTVPNSPLPRCSVNSSSE